MDLLTHILSGAAIGGAVGVSKKKGMPFIFGGIGAALPDIDAISLWSGFDAHIGHKLGLTYSGHDIYFGKLWYSHHAITHSLMACFVTSLLMYWILGKRSKHATMYALSFGLGYMMHLLGDMPTPGSVWDGIALYWPFSYYEGGSGHTWWWNNYDIFLICLMMVITLIIIFVLIKYFDFILKKYISIGIVVMGFSLCFYQLMTRPYYFDYTGRTTDFWTLESESLKIQEEILGERVYQWMRKLDEKVGIQF